MQGEFLFAKMCHMWYSEHMRYRVFRTEEFDDWFEGQKKKTKQQIRTRIQYIEEYEHLGDHKHIEGEIWELKWKNGRRIYYAYLKDENILLLLGGNKNGQNKDIIQAKRILKTYTCI